jgi:hypothetical protein
VVTRAAGLARDAGHDLIFILADDNDWPKQLYARIGFRSAGCGSSTSADPQSRATSTHERVWQQWDGRRRLTAAP